VTLPERPHRAGGVELVGEVFDNDIDDERKQAFAMSFQVEDLSRRRSKSSV